MFLALRLESCGTRLKLDRIDIDSRYAAAERDDIPEQTERRSDQFYNRVPHCPPDHACELEVRIFQVSVDGNGQPYRAIGVLKQ